MSRPIEYNLTRCLPKPGAEFIGSTIGDAQQYINTQAQHGWRLHSVALDAEGGTLVVMERGIAGADERG